jgi:hypothetical protein
MTEQEVKKAPKPKKKPAELEFKIGDITNPPARDINSELDEASAVFKAKKGQAGTRKAGPYDGPGPGVSGHWCPACDPIYGPL